MVASCGFKTHWESNCNCCLRHSASLSLSQTHSTVSPYESYFCTPSVSLFLHGFHGNHHLLDDCAYIFISHHIFPLCSIKSLVLLAGVCVSWSRCSRVIWGHWWSRSSGSVLWDPNPTGASEHVTESRLTLWALMSSSLLWQKRQAKITRGVTWRSCSMRPVIFISKKTSWGLLWTSVCKTEQKCFFCADGHLLRRSCWMANVPQLHVSALQAHHKLHARL